MLRSKFILFLYHLVSSILGKIFPKKVLKEKMEYFYWWVTKKKEKELRNTHYQEFYTTQMNLSLDFYTNKTILDIGCGPRGSLEWAENSETFAIDPLIEEYKKLGIDGHKTLYFKAFCEEIPFPDNYLDIVSSFNSLDHVDNLEKSIAEIKRVTKPKGLFLLIADIHKNATICEPSAFSWDILEKFKPEFTIELEKHFEGENMYKSIRKGVTYDHENATERYGILTAKLIKNEI